MRRHEIKSRKVKLWSAVQLSGILGPKYFNLETARKVFHYQTLAFQSCEKLNNSHRVLFCSQIDILLILHLPYTPFWMRGFRNHELENMVQQARYQDKII